MVDALNGEPGIYSARYAGTGNDDDNNALLLKNMQNVPDEKRTARFVSCIACVFPDGREFTVKGFCEGTILREPKGNGGFGYDPLFDTEFGCFCELSPEEKNKISHRANAAAKFSEEIKKYI
jgi:XTP/dITP diphosphohydrolase